MPAVPVWPRIILLWHAAVLIPLSIGCYISAHVLFGDIVYHPMARLPIMLLGAALATITILLVVSAFSRSRRVLRLALKAVFILDMQIAVLVLMYALQIENAGLLGDLSAGLPGLIAFVAFAMPAAAAVMKLRDLRPPPDGALASGGG